MKDQHSRYVEAGKFFLGLILSTACATGSATWTARGILADLDRRVSVIETNQQSSDQSFSRELAEIRTDMREVRTDLREVRNALIGRP